VCFVIDRLRRAGTETQLVKLIDGLDRNCVKPYLCILDGGDEISKLLEPKDCPVLRLGVRSLRRLSSFLYGWRFVQFLWREHIDIVQTHFSDSTYFAVPMARLAGVRYVIRARRDLGFWMRPIDRLLGRVYNHLLTATIANCAACRCAVISQEHVPPNAVVVLENGIDLRPFAGIPPVWRVSNGRTKRVGMVANLRPIKGPEVFIEAAQIVASRHGNVHFEVAGNGINESLLGMVRNAGIENCFRFYGSIDNVPAFLSRLDVAVLTSYSEGLSNAMLEYMAAGRPIVATAVGANSELLQGGRLGLLVPPRNSLAVADAIDFLLRNAEHAAALGSACREYVRRKYTFKAMIAKYELFYRTLSHSKKTIPRSLGKG
jgi:glycosyltransferase involved in cell wall biosynthesis